ncbi:MAG: (2Fe-2S)-binding protein [Proteobacteria bacterium]|nr:(2Fe-2S)-binding protein [Pseudomonadota bacterium]
MSSVIKKIILNGSERMVDAPEDMRLLDVLRQRLSLTGTKEGCGEGECGACSVLLNGEAVNSCLVLWGQLSDGAILTTVEGLGSASHLSPLQECFVKEGGVQCGMCTPGMLVSAEALLMRNPKPARGEIVRAISGNLCRCTGYKRIISAVEECSKLKKGKR